MTIEQETKETLSEIKEDLRLIKSTLNVVVRLEETVKHHHETLTRIVNKFDSCEKRLGKAELSIATGSGKATGTNNFAMWVAAFASAFLIAILISNMKPANSAALHTEQKALVTKVIKSKDKKDD